jgi:ubiquitin
MQQMLAMAANPNFPQLRARILQNPAFYQEFMSMLERTQP